MHSIIVKCFLLKPEVIPLLLLPLFLAACTGTRDLPKEDKLYTGAQVKITSRNGEIDNVKHFETDIEGEIRPVPNETFLFIFRPKLAIYNAIDSVKKQKGLKYSIKKEVGEPPVLLSQVDPVRTAELIEEELRHEGFFDATVDYEIIKEKKTASIKYTAVTDQPYTINRVSFPQGSWELYRKVAETQKGTLLEKGSRYDLDLLKQERIRIDSLLKQEGYFHFSPEYIIFRADSSTDGNRRVDLQVDIKLAIPHEATVPYVVNDIYIYPNYNLGRDTLPGQADTLLLKGYRYITADSLFKPRAVLRAIALEPGKVYTRADHDFTLIKLTELGVFKFVNLDFVELPEADSGRMDIHIYLIPIHRRSVRVELQALAKSNNFAGPVLTTSYRDRNLFKGAELFVLRLNAAYEAQFRKSLRAYNAYEFGVDGELYIPRFITPFKIKSESRLYLPRTQFLLGVERVSRMALFSVNSFNAVAGYTWHESQEKRHELNPLAVNYLQLSQTSAEFEQLLQTNLQLQESYREQFTIGGTYSYLYNTQADNMTHKNDYYFNGNIDLSGNTVALIEKLSGINVSDFTRAPYAQYAKFETDFRYYHKLTDNTRLATRAFAGIGIPYGNSQTLPFLKQYFSGGPNSVRAFPARALGPGAYSPGPDSLNFFIGRAGDIKLEANVEYRFPIIGLFKGAVFMDAGNSWLMRKNPAFPQGNFEAGNILQQIAVGIGAGLRIDATFFVLRFDLATPIRSPYPDEITNNASTGSLVDLGNIVLNVALGYPF